MAKLLDYNGLSYFWENVKVQIDAKVDKPVDEELDATSHHPVENMAIKLGIDALRADLEDQADTTNTFFYILYDSIMPYVGSGTVTNSYESKCYCVKNNAVVTIYFDIEGNYGDTIFPITEVVPGNCRPYVDITNLIAQSTQGLNNIMIDKSSGQILITSENGIFNVHCAVTYIVVPSDAISTPDIDPAIEGALYSVKARMVKIGNYYPTYNSNDNTISGYTVRGAALTTDAIGSQFSGYEGNYTVYLVNSKSTYAGNEQFYWNKKFGDTITDDKGSLFTFNECFEAASSINEAALIEHGCAAVEELVENGNTIQYFVTSFGKHAWIGGVDSPYNAIIKEKAYGATSGAGDYNGRFYWTDCILAHVLRFVPASIEQGGVAIADKSRPVEKNGTTIGYIDKVVPLKLIEKAYSWGNFTYANGTTWRGAKLYCQNIETPSTEALNAKFSGHLVISDWNKASATGNIYSNDTYYQRIDSKLNEEEQSSGDSGSSVHIPDWLKNLPSYDTLMDSTIASEYSGIQLYNGHIDIAVKSVNNEYYVARFYPYANISDDPSYSTIPFNTEIFEIAAGFEGELGISIADPTETYDINYGAMGWALLKYNGSAWEVYPDEYFIQDITEIWNDDIGDYIDNTEAHVVQITGGIRYDFTEFGATWRIQPEQGGGVETITTIQQSPVYVRPNSTWNKTTNKLSTYDNTDHEFD